jgi:ubiquinone biosynthesis protein
LIKTMLPHWDHLLDEASLASLLPAEYVHFARPIRDGLAIFLSGLPAPQQAKILQAQARLPPDSGFARRIGLLAQSSPVLQKLGQVLARDERLAGELRYYLRELESLPPTVPLATIEATLREELGPLETRGITLLPPAIAEASVAVVIPFSQAAGVHGPTAVEGVFKVLKPGIEQQLEQELRLLAQVGEHLDARCDELQIPQLDYEESFRQVHGKLWDEVQLDMEQRHLVQAKTFFADEPQVHIPALLAHCTSRVTAMERIFGGKVTRHGLNQPGQKRKLASLIAKALVAKSVFSKSELALFHGDPHAGNLFFTNDGRLAILDWSLVGALGVRERVAIVQVLLAALTLDAQRIARVLAPLADPQRLDEPALHAVAERGVQQVRGGQLPGLTWLVGLLDDAVQHAQLRVSTDLMLFRKALHTLQGVVADVGESSRQLDQTLSREFLRHFLAEWPQRWLLPPHARNFATRLSNFDVTQTLFSGSLTLARFWTGRALDTLEANVSRVAPSAPCADATRA